MFMAQLDILALSLRAERWLQLVVQGSVIAAAMSFHGWVGRQRQRRAIEQTRLDDAIEPQAKLEPSVPI
jgi:hypothetical protein